MKMMTHFLFKGDAGNGLEDEAQLISWLPGPLEAWVW